MNEMSDLDLGWIVGLFEGEGTFSISGDATNALQITSTDRDVLDRFQSIVGIGNVYNKKKRQPHHKDQWMWGTGKGSEVQALTLKMLPHLSKRRQARAMDALEQLERRRVRSEKRILCTVKDCERKHKSVGLCQHHYDKQRRSN